jgi:hypothetical protein
MNMGAAPTKMCPIGIRESGGNYIAGMELEFVPQQW